MRNTLAFGAHARVFLSFDSMDPVNNWLAFIEANLATLQPILVRIVGGEDDYEGRLAEEAKQSESRPGLFIGIWESSSNCAWYRFRYPG